MLLWTLVILLPAVVLSQVDITGLANYEFNRFDLNQNGNIEALEVQTYFGRFDTNHDNRISRQEYQHEVDSHHVNNPQAQDVLHRLFDALDFDNDNHIDGPDYLDLLTTADTNHNNLVSQPEFLAFFYDLTGISPAGK